MFFLLGIPALISGIASTGAAIGSAAGAAIGSAAGAAAAAAGSATAAVGSAAAAVGSAAATAATTVGGAIGGLGANGVLGAATKGVLGVAAKKTAVNKAVQVAAMATVALAGNKLVGQDRKKMSFLGLTPRRGSILKVDLVGGVADHTGVYLGGGRIAEVTDVDGSAVVRVVDPEEFVSGDGLCRTGLHAYVACARDGMGFRPLASGSIASRAESAVGDRGGYSLVFNNCHMFTRYCITGDNDGTPCLSVDAIESALRKRFDEGSVFWCKAEGGAFT